MRTVVPLAVIAAVLAFASTAQAAKPAEAGSFVLTANSPGGTYAPTFTGNGTLGVRVPPSGQGYAGGTVPAQSELAGFYGQVSGDPKPANDVQQRANIPTWSTLTFSDGGQAFTVPGAGVSRWRQSIDLHTGLVTTTARWTAPDGHVTDLTYEVLTDRANPSLGLVRLEFTPQWSGVATVTDAIDGTADETATPELTTQISKGWNVATHQDWVTVGTKGTGIQATLASQLQVSPNVACDDHPDRPEHRSERRAGAWVPGERGSDLHDHQVRRASRAPRTSRTPRQPRRRTPPVRPPPGGPRCSRPTSPRGRRCGADGSRSAATVRSRPTSTPASSTCGRARATASTGACRRRAYRPTATTATSSGTPRPGCTRRCSPSTRTSPPA